MRTLKLSTRLTKARALVADRSSWTHGAFKRKASKSPIGASYCALGACAAVTDDWAPDKKTPGYGTAMQEMRHALDACAAAAGYPSIMSLNDRNRKPAQFGDAYVPLKERQRRPADRHADVLAAFDCAIAKAKKAERAAAAYKAASGT